MNVFLEIGDGENFSQMLVEEVYITMSNLQRIVKSSKNRDMQGEVYKNEIKSLNKQEKNELLAIRELLKNPEKYFQEIYRPLEAKHDSYQWVYVSEQPAYHMKADCNCLNSDYKNFRIPKEIQEKKDKKLY